MPRTYPNLPGNPVSVTSILSAVFPKPALEIWKQNRAAELAREFPDEPIKGLLARHPGEAMQRGKLVHQSIEGLLTWRTRPKLRGADLAMMNAWEAWWFNRDLVIDKVEQVTYGDGWAGTFDLSAYDKGELTVFDWKTCTVLPDQPWPDHMAQVAAYRFGAGAVRASIVYISSREVREFIVDNEAMDRASDLFVASLAMCKALHPEWFSGGRPEVGTP